PGGCDRRRRHSSSARTFCGVGAGPRSQQTTSAAEAFRVSGCNQPGHTQTRGDDYIRAICLGAIRTEYFAHAPFFDRSALSSPQSQTPHTLLGEMRMSEIGAADVQMFFDGSIEAGVIKDGAIASKPAIKDFCDCCSVGIHPEKSSERSPSACLDGREETEHAHAATVLGAIERALGAVSDDGFIGCLVRNALWGDFWASLAICRF